MAAYKKLLPGRIAFLVVHHSASRPSQDWGVRDIRAMHLKRGFFREGYHYIVRRDGTIEVGRPEDMPGAHVSSFNGKSLGICMIGGVTEKDVKVPEDNFTDAQFVSLKRLLRDLTERYPQARVVGHKDLDRKKPFCPAFDLAAKLREWGIGVRSDAP